MTRALLIDSHLDVTRSLLGTRAAKVLGSRETQARAVSVRKCQRYPGEAGKSMMARDLRG